MHIIEYIISLVAPHYCVGCDVIGPILCNTCANNLPKPLSRCYRCGVLGSDFRTCAACSAVSGLQSVWYATPYEGLPKKIIYKLKFERASAAANAIANVMATRLPRNEDWLVTFAPTALSRARARGYDQAQLIARRLATLLQCPYASLLVRQGRQRQVGTTRQQRVRQLRSAYISISRGKIQGQTILLIDDVITTGSTLDAAAAALYAAGAARVEAAVFAVA